MAHCVTPIHSVHFTSSICCAKQNEAPFKPCGFWLLGDSYKQRFALCYGTVVLSVCLSVCLYVTRQYCAKTTARSTVQFLSLIHI